MSMKKGNWKYWRWMMNVLQSVAIQTEVRDTTETELYSRSVHRHRLPRTRAGHKVPLAVVSTCNSHAISAASLKENDAQTKLYTCKWAPFMQVFQFLSPFIVPSYARLYLQDKLILKLVSTWPFNTLRFDGEWVLVPFPGCFTNGSKLWMNGWHSL